MKSLWKKLGLFFANMTAKRKIVCISVSAVLLICSIAIPIVLLNGGKNNGEPQNTGQTTELTTEQVTEPIAEDTAPNIEDGSGGGSGGGSGDGSEDDRSECEINGHSYGAPTYVWNDDHTECVATRVCANDSSHKEIENGTVTSVVTKKANCTEKGETTYTATFENTAFATQSKSMANIPIDASRHVYGEPTVEWNAAYTDCTVTRFCSAGDHTDDTLTKLIETASDGAKTVKVYDGNETQIASFTFKQKPSGGYYLYQSEVKNIYYVNGSSSGNISVKTYDEEGNVLSEGNKFIFEGYAPDSDDSEFG